MKSAGMGAVDERQTVREGAVEHLEDALESEDSNEKDFHLKQALQLLRVADEE